MTNGKIIRLLVEDEPLDIRYGELRRHERVLDLRAGVLRRTLQWTSPTGRSVRIASTRLVSFTQRAVAAILYEVEAVDEPTRWSCSPSSSPTRRCRAATAIHAPPPRSHRRCNRSTSSARRHRADARALDPSRAG